MLLIAGYPVDVAVSEDHSFDSEVTEHPVERGADVADHVRARPITLTIEGLVSDDPIGTVRDQRLASAGGSIEHAPPSDDAFALLLSVRDAREPVTIVTSLRTYEDMVLTSLSVPRGARTGHALRFMATFVQVQLVTNLRTTVRVAVPRAAKKVNLGNKPITPAPESAPPPAAKTEETTRQYKDSWLGRGLESLGVL